MGKRRIAFVMEQTLGSVTHYLNLRAHESAADGIAPLWLPIEFRPGRLPWALRGSLLARRSLASVAEQVEGCFVHTTTLSLLSAGQFRRTPAVLSTDGTALNKREVRAEYNLEPESGAARSLKRAVYLRAFRSARGFVVWSGWAKASLVQDYGCREEDVAVIPPGIDVRQFAPGDRAHEIPRILFVGGDFQRKGGSLLLDVFRKRLRGRASLVLVTRDPVPAEPGVEVHPGLPANSPELRRLYAECDLFALPTRADCFSIVCMEAMASGMPVVTTRVGGIPDIVREGETGHLVERDDPAALGDALESLVSDARRRSAMGEAGRADAIARFDAEGNARRLFQFVASRCP
ncbi:MAG TPA: glycosyltransferase family 4 protein [Myxococcales bacterium]|nr:glycosyltransferase family 4 protein [Myxococcales bacterium]